MKEVANGVVLAICFLLVSCLAYLTLKVGAAHFSKTLVDLPQALLHYITEDGAIYDCCCENHKSYILNEVCYICKNCIHVTYILNK
jgi:hypothetical protein